MERSSLASLLAMSDEDASEELARLHLIMNEEEWQDLCDEYVVALVNKILFK